MASEASGLGKLAVLELIQQQYYCVLLENLVHQYLDQILEHLCEWYPATWLISVLTEE